MKNKEIVDSVRGNSIMLLVLEDFKILPDKAHQNALSKPVRESIDSIILKPFKFQMVTIINKILVTALL